MKQTIRIWDMRICISVQRSCRSCWIRAGRKARSMRKKISSNGRCSKTIKKVCSWGICMLSRLTTRRKPPSADRKTTLWVRATASFPRLISFGFGRSMTATACSLSRPTAVTATRIFIRWPIWRIPSSITGISRWICMSRNSRI